jgi:hypothetical protein
VPLLTEQGEFQASASYGNGMNVNAAFALTNHIGITGGALYANNKLQRYDNTYRTHQSAEGALGYFGKKKQFSYEVYVGYGGGKGYAQDSTFGFFFFNNTQDVFQGTYRKGFIQPTFAFNLKRFQFAYTTRVTGVDFSRLGISVNSAGQKALPRRRFYFFEPSVTAKYFIKAARASIYTFAQVGFNVTEQPGENEANVRYSLLHYNLGFGIRLSRR